MDKKTYEASLAQCVKDTAWPALFEQAQSSMTHHRAPLNNFFNDDFLTLIHFSDVGRLASANPALYVIKAALEQVADRKQPHRLRAQAAVALGRFVWHDEIERAERTERTVLSHPSRRSKPAEWFQHARVLSSVPGAWEYANTLLAQAQARIEFDLDQSPLPAYIASQIPESRRFAQNAYVSPDLALAWHAGVLVALRHMQGRFKDWRTEDFHCALACLVNYMTLMDGSVLTQETLARKRRQRELSWIDALWKRLIHAAPAVVSPDDPDAYRNALADQRLAVLAAFKDASDGQSTGAPAPSGSASAASSAATTDLASHMRSHPDGPRSRTPREQQAEKQAQQQAREQALSMAREKLVVVTTPIWPSNDREEKGMLEQFAVLHQEVPLTELPSLEALIQIEAQLSMEFPWAEQAIGLVMDDLFARRANGGLRLGIAPLLLAGPPGSGKTRFAQRLGTLLSTPNTVFNLAGMTDTKLLKGCSRGWGGARASRIVEFIQQTFRANPLFILDEIDKVGLSTWNGDPQSALLDLLEPGNARRYHDVFLLAECDLSHCLYVATANELNRLSEPLLTRLRPVLFPKPGPEHADVLIQGVLRDLETAWGLPVDTLVLTSSQQSILRGLAPREMRAAALQLLGQQARRRKERTASAPESSVYRRH